jgi:two-component system OmpR family sensor kinase
MTSIRRRLLVWLLSGLTLGVVGAGIRIYLQTLDEADQLFDYHLKSLAASLPNEAFGRAPPARPDLSDVDQGDFVVQIWDRSGIQLYFSHPSSHLPDRAELGYSTVVTERGPWRVYSMLADGTVVQVAQPMSVRRTLAAGMALRAVFPLLLLLPVLGGLIWLTVGHGLRPLRKLTSAVGRRTAQSLDPLPDDGLPVEIRPLVSALNDLLARLGRSLDSQKAFVADAAHELRTPLAALHLQLQLAERAKTDEARRSAFDDLRRGLARASQAVNQLLTLARAEQGGGERAFAAVSLVDVAREAVAAHDPLAVQKGIDLGVSHEDAVTIAGDFEALRVLAGNLVENAIRYTPRGGTVDVAVRDESGEAVLEVVDTGPGIPESHRERVFDRFYRMEGSEGPGSGLGLAIVKSVADRHGASVTLGDRADGAGLRVLVRFPRASARPGMGA